MLLCSLATPGYAQDAAAFRTADLGLGVVIDPGTAGTLHQYWNPGLGVEATVSAPFYAGTVELGIQRAHHDARGNDVPGFRGRLLFLGWGHGVPLGSRVRAGGGLRLGVYEIRFDGDTIPDFRRDESEMAMALRSAVGYELGARWRAHAAAAYQVVFTHRHIEQLLLSVGVSRAFPLPSWLRDFLD